MDSEAESEAEPEADCEPEVDCDTDSLLEGRYFFKTCF